jgi:hypothetical protein
MASSSAKFSDPSVMRIIGKLSAGWKGNSRAQDVSCYGTGLQVLGLQGVGASPVTTRPGARGQRLSARASDGDTTTGLDVR